VCCWIVLNRVTFSPSWDQLVNKAFPPRLGGSDHVDARATVTH
jgi:hypothetical protein